MVHAERGTPESPAGGTAADVIAPDTEGMNFYAADQGLRDLLALYCEGPCLDAIEPALARLGGLAANELDRLAHLANAHGPVLHPRDRYGRDRWSIEFHPAYDEMVRIAFSEFGIHALSHRGGIVGWPEPLPTPAKHAFTFLFNEAEFGLGCPINVTDSTALLLSRYGSDALKARYLDRLLATEMDRLIQGAQFMTEKEGGSDVGTLTSRAVKDGDVWRIWGEKWFCSNADAGLVALLARPEGAGPGTRGLGMFLMPRFLEDGSQNHYRVVRLKDKLGTRSMASGEIRMEGALAYALGRLDRGFLQMTDMVNNSRLSNGVKSAALMRRALHDALQVARHRVAFGRRIIELPLTRRQLLKMILPAEQALSLWMHAAALLDKAEGRAGATAPSQQAAASLRLLTPVLKFRATRDARKVTGDALEMRGGNGYVEDWVNPRLVRDAYLGSVWEGTSNIVALDAIGRAVGRHGAESALAAGLLGLLDEAPSLPAAYGDRLRRIIDQAVRFAADIASRPEDELSAREAASALYHSASAVLLAWEGAWISEKRGDARRLVLSRLAVDHRLGRRDPFTRTNAAREERIATWLLSPQTVEMRDITDYVTGT